MSSEPAVGENEYESIWSFRNLYSLPLGRNIYNQNRFAL